MPFDAAQYAPFGYTQRGTVRLRAPRPGEGHPTFHVSEVATEYKRVRSMICQRIARAKLRGAQDQPVKRRHDWPDVPAALLCCELLIERHARRKRQNGFRNSGAGHEQDCGIGTGQ